MPRVAGWLAWAFPFIVYLVSLNGAVAYWDTGEAQVVPWIFGIMHPTGFPAYTLLAGIFAHIVAIGSVAWRVSLFSALAMSGTAWLISRIVLELECRPWIALSAAWLFAFGEIAWTRGTRAEVHSLATLFAIAALYASIRWYRTGDARVLITGALAWGLGIATHPIDALLFPAFAVLLAVRLRSVTVRSLALALTAFFFGVAWYAYLPVRSAIVTAAHLDPTRSLDVPPGRPFWDNDHPSSWQGFIQEAGGTEFSAGGALAGMLSPRTYMERFPSYWLGFIAELTPIGVLLCLGALYALARRDAWLSIALLFAWLFPTAFAFAFAIEADKQRYYLIGFAIACILVGYAASAIVRALPALHRGVLAGAFILPIGLLVVNRDTFEQRNSSGAQAVIATAIKNTPRNAVLISPWLYATPLAYGAYVEHRLGDRILETSWLADDAARVPAWMHKRPVYVVGILFGDVPGTQLVRIPGSPDLWHVVPERLAQPLRLRSSHRTFGRRHTTTSSCSPTHSCTVTHGSRGRDRTSTH